MCKVHKLIRHINCCGMCTQTTLWLSYFLIPNIRRKTCTNMFSLWLHWVVYNLKISYRTPVYVVQACQFFTCRQPVSILKGSCDIAHQVWDKPESTTVYTSADTHAKWWKDVKISIFYCGRNAALHKLYNIWKEEFSSAQTFNVWSRFGTGSFYINRRSSRLNVCNQIHFCSIFV